MLIPFSEDIGLCGQVVLDTVISFLDRFLQSYASRELNEMTLFLEASVISKAVFFSKTLKSRKPFFCIKYGE